MNATMNSTAISPASRNHLATCRSARLSAGEPGMYRSPYSASSTPSSAMPSAPSSSRDILARSASSGTCRFGFPLMLFLRSFLAQEQHDDADDSLGKPRSCSGPHPQRRRHDRTHADQEGDQALGCRAEPAGGVATGIDGRLVVLNVGNDRRLLVGRQLTVAELRHVLRAAEHGAVDLPVGGRVEIRRVLAL